MKYKVFLSLLYILQCGFIFAQSPTKEDLQKELEQCECLLNTFKKYSNVNDKFWSVVEDGGLVNLGTKSKPGDQPKQIFVNCPNNPKQGLFTHKQVVSNIKKGEQACQQIRAKLGRYTKDGEKTNVGSTEKSDAEKFRQSMRNIQNASMMIQESRARASQVARDLQQYNDVGNSSDPYEIMSRYNYNVQQIQEIQDAFKQSATNSTINNVTQVTTDYLSGNDEGAFYGGLGILGTIAENQEAKEAIKRERQELERKKHNAMVRAANALIEANTEAQNKWLEAASRALEEDKENYYMEYALYHGSFVNYINSNFNSSNTKWANNPYKQPEKPFFKRNRGSLAEQHYEAAKRKEKLYEDHNKNPILYEGIVMHLSAAINEDEENDLYYRELASFTNSTDLVLSLQSYLAAYELNPNAFTIEKKIEYNQIKELVSQDIAKVLSNQNEVRMREYIDAGLYSVLRVNDQTPWEIAMEKDYEKIVSIIYHEEMPHWSNYEQQGIIQKGIFIASQYGSVKSLDLLREEGESLEFKRGSKTPLIIASEYQQLEVFRYLLFRSKNRKISQKPFNNSAILIFALADQYPAEASEQLCGIQNQEKLENTIDELLSFNHSGKNTPKIESYTSTSKEQLANQFGTINSQYSNSAVNKTNNSTSSYQAPYLERAQLAKVLGACSKSKNAILETAEFRSKIQKNFRDALKHPVAQSTEAQRAIYYLNNDLIAPDYLDSNKTQLTVTSIKNDNHEVLNWLQKNKYDVIEDEKGMPISHYFLSLPQNIISAKLYRKYSFNKSDQDGVSFIHKLMFSKKASYLLTLLVQDKLINVNQPGLFGWTALHYATRENNLELVSKLIAFGADKKAKDKWRRTAYDIAKERKYKALKNSLK